ncbi:MAG: hypothetical protein MZU84_01280 [Sphingobacterium sp.]|nr:hypothetical protein [Sphingobacterium sp.]
MRNCPRRRRRNEPRASGCGPEPRFRPGGSGAFPVRLRGGRLAPGIPGGVSRKPRLSEETVRCAGPLVFRDRGGAVPLPSEVRWSQEKDGAWEIGFSVHAPMPEDPRRGISSEFMNTTWSHSDGAGEPGPRNPRPRRKKPRTARN